MSINAVLSLLIICMFINTIYYYEKRAKPNVKNKQLKSEKVKNLAKCVDDLDK